MANGITNINKGVQLNAPIRKYKIPYGKIESGELVQFNPRRNEVIASDFSWDTITNGSEINFSGDCSCINVVSLSENKFLTVFKENGEGKVVVLEVVEDGVLAGTSFTFTQDSIYDTTMTKLSNNKVCVCYGNSSGEFAIIIEINGDTIQCGNKLQIESVRTNETVIKRLSENKIAVIYRYMSNFRGYITILNVSERVISSGNRLEFSTYSLSLSLIIESETEVIIVFRENTSIATLVKYSINGNSMTRTIKKTIVEGVNDIYAAKSLNSQILVIYRDHNDSEKGKGICVQIDGTTVTQSQYPRELQSELIDRIESTILSDEEMIIAYRGNESKYSFSRVFIASYGPTFYQESYFGTSFTEPPKMFKLDMEKILVVYISSEKGYAKIIYPGRHPDGLAIEGGVRYDMIKCYNFTLDN